MVSIVGLDVATGFLLFGFLQNMVITLDARCENQPRVQCQRFDISVYPRVKYRWRITDCSA